MTKHLRLIMLSLLAMICLGGYSQSEEDFTTKTWSNPYLFEHYKIVGEQGGNGNKGLIPRQNENSKDIRCYSDNKLTITSTQGKMKKIVFVLSTQGKQQCGQPTVDNGTVTRSPKSATISEVIWENPNGSASVTFTVGASNNWGTNTSKSSGQLCFNKIIITDLVSIEDNRQDAGIHFAKDSYTADITGGTFKGAELVKPVSIKKVMYTISPESEGVSIAEDGTVTYPAVEATYTVTAKFAGNDTYKPATATYTLNVVDPNFETRIIEFEAGKDKGTGANTNGIKDDMISKGIVTVSSTRACLGLKDYYAFYKPVSTNEGIHTISTRMGTITKIAFEAGNGKEPSKATFTEGTYTKDNDDTKNYTWTGSEKTINFTVTASTYYSKITVTVKVPVAKDYTLDENSVNTIEAYENANVTLTRKLVGDVWNTLSVPFSLSAEQAKEAFGDEVQLRELESVQDNTLNFKTVNSITAGVPCLIKLTKAFAKDTYTFTGVQTIAAKADDLAEGEVKGAISFIGIYSPTDVTTWASADKEYAVFLGAGNQFFKAQAGTEMKGFRAFFLVPNNVPNSAVKVVIDGTATGIEDLVIDGVKANGRVYNLNGQYVGNSLNGLQPGIYIQNGKKIVVK